MTTDNQALTLVTEHQWVDSDARLAELCERWSQQAALAIDTEFMRSHTFYPHAGLIQVGDGRGCYLIDPLAIEDFSPLRELMTNESVVKVLHSSSEDLEVFRFLLGVLPSPLFDTQVAAAFAGYGFSCGYAPLVKAVLGVELEKGETRSDWMARPLSQSQLHYAALDVAYLLVVYGKLLLRLKEQNRLAWVQEDCAELIANARVNNEGEESWHKFKSAWKLNAKQLMIAKTLSDWRELEARERDIPRNRLLKEGAVVELAQMKPTRHHQLSRVEGLPPRTQREDGETILSLIEEALNVPESECPERLPMPLPASKTVLMKALKQVVRDIAEKEDMPSEILVRKKELETLVRGEMVGSPVLSGRLLGWRQSFVGEALLAAASKG